MYIYDCSNTDDIVIKGTGTLEGDKKQFDDAVSVLNKNGGTCFIDGVVLLDSPLVFTNDISLRGKSSKSRILFGSNGTIQWNPKARPDLLDSDIFTTGGGEKFTCKNNKLSAGDLVILYSDNQIENLRPHHTNGGQHPMEIHKVESVFGDDVYISDNIVDTMDKNPKMSTFKACKDIVCADLQCEFVGEEQQNYMTALYFCGCDGVLLENVRFDRNGPGAISFQHSYNCSVNNLVIDGVKARDGVYGLVAGTVNGLLIADSYITGPRHVFTTTCGMGFSNRRWGTCLNTKMSNCTLRVPTAKDSTKTGSRVGIDSHPEGHGLVFDGCLINIGNDVANVGAQTRSRNTVFRNCIFRGGRITKSLRIYSPNVTVENCLFEDSWYSIFADYEESSNITIRGCAFKNSKSPAIILNKGSGHSVSDCIFIGCGGSPSSGYKKALVEYKGNPVVSQQEKFYLPYWNC